MRIKKVILTTIIALAIAATAYGEGNTWIELLLSDGTRQAYIVSGGMRIDFSNDSIRLNTTDITASYSLKRVKSYRFQKDVALEDAIYDTSLADIRIERLENKHIRITGLNSGNRVCVYATNGIKLSEQRADNNGSATIDFTSMPDGTYLITTQETSLKIFVH